MQRAQVRLVRRDSGPLGERWALPRRGETERATLHDADALEESFARGGITLTLDAAAVLATGRPAGPEGDTAVALAPGIRMLPVRTPTLPPATHTNLFVVGTREAVLIEPAASDDEELDRVVRWVTSLEAEGLRFREILLTHHHRDHVGGARALSRALGLPLAAHAATGSRLPRGVSLARTVRDGERIVLEGAIPMVLRAVHTPGHAPGHLCFFEERSGVLIAGDMVAQQGTILIEPTEGDMALYLDSLRRMATLGATALAPAHGGVLRPPVAVLDRYITHRLAREQRILEALRRSDAEATASELLPEAYADVPRSVWPLALLSTEAHLVKLEREGKVARVGTRWRAI